jgi:hypothetical protein
MTIEVIGVYHANGGLFGEIAYVFGKVFGKTECALCDLTHRVVSEKGNVQSWRRGLSYPLTFKHLNELSAQMSACVANESPCVVLQHGGDMSILIDRHELRAMNGDEQSLMRCIESRVADLV